ncbi:guanylate kinase [bacterium]|nr:guanylate kinase [bacterium]MBQ4439223.1 guanylate kinase [bacterium]
MNDSKHTDHGKIFVISAPSGAGKTTLVGLLRERFPLLAESVSCTTRNPRGHEVDGVDYFFLSKDEFFAKREAGLFAEWAEVHGNFYGTPLDFLQKQLESGKDIICDIDYQGAINIKKAFPEEAVLILVLPPSMEELESRLRLRATDNPEVIKTRLHNAKNEILHYPHFDFVVVNNDLNTAAAQMTAIISAHTDSSIFHNMETIKKLTE